MVNRFLVSALGLFGQIRFQRGTGGIVGPVPLRYYPIEDPFRPLTNATGDYRLRRPNCAEYVRQLARRDRIDRKMPDGRPDNPGYFVNPLGALTIILP